MNMTGSVINGTVMNVVCFARVCFERLCFELIDWFIVSSLSFGIMAHQTFDVL